MKTSGEESRMDRQEVKKKIDYFTYDLSPHGITYGGWTVKWWKWWFSIERAKNPAQDESGIYANQKQSRPTWFLAGTWVQKERKYPHRKCSLPPGVSILFPIINCEENPLEYPELISDDAMRHKLLDDMDTVKDLKCIINDEVIPPQLVESDPRFFEIWIRKDMSENGRGGKTRMTASGYWVYLGPLNQGDYHISFEGSYRYGKLYTGATYDITVKGNSRDV